MVPTAALLLASLAFVAALILTIILATVSNMVGMEWLRAGLQVAVFSNHGDPATRRRCLALGADAVFDKSREIDALVHWCSRQAVAAPWRERKPRRPHWIRPFLSA